MDQRLDLITLAVPDLKAARDFYLRGLGWTAALDLPEILFLQVGHGLLLGLFPAGDLAVDIGTAAPSAPSGFTLAHNVASPQEVDAVLHTAADAGAKILKAGQRAEFGGYHGYFSDPSGVVWEVAHNSGWSVAADGRVTIVPIPQ